jgi:uncharacterized protein (DUF362 family)
MPKVKTQHWIGVTLSMKNMFGIAPGQITTFRMFQSGKGECVQSRCVSEAATAKFSVSNIEQTFGLRIVRFLGEVNRERT